MAATFDSGSLAEQREIVYRGLSEFAHDRARWYRNSKSATLASLMSKDIVMFAARGVATAEEFVEEAFRARESTSEETVMGNLRQRLCVAVSKDTLDTGDITTARDGDLYVCELKSQRNTVNAASFPQELRELKERCTSIARHRRTSGQNVLPAFCVMRAPQAVDEWREYQCAPHDRANLDLSGFRYRYLQGSAFWQWLIGMDSIDDLIEDFGALDLGDVVQARVECLERLKGEMRQALEEEGLGASITDVLKLRSRRFR